MFFFLHLYALEIWTFLLKLASTEICERWAPRSFDACLWEKRRGWMACKINGIFFGDKSSFITMNCTKIHYLIFGWCLLPNSWYDSFFRAFWLFILAQMQQFSESARSPTRFRVKIEYTRLVFVLYERNVDSTRRKSFGLVLAYSPPTPFSIARPRTPIQHIMKKNLLKKKKIETANQIETNAFFYKWSAGYRCRFKSDYLLIESSLCSLLFYHSRRRWRRATVLSCQLLSIAEFNIDAQRNVFSYSFSFRANSILLNLFFIIGVSSLWRH